MIRGYNLSKPTLMLISMTLMFFSQQAYAGKIDDVKNAVKEKCKTELAQDQVLESVIKAFDCTEGSDVKIGSCTIKCLKASAGNVVGGK